MKYRTLFIACLIGLASVDAFAVSRLPPKIPVHVDSTRVTLDLRPLLAQTNDIEITRISACRRFGSRCQQTLWNIEFPSGWQGEEVELLGDYPDARVLARAPGLLQPGGSYNVIIHFNERSRWHGQTVSNTIAEFCLTGDAADWKRLDDTACLTRRNAENQQGAKP